MITATNTADELIRSALDGRLSKADLADALDADNRLRFLRACAAIERQYTEACGTSGDPCLESGCSVDHEHGEACLQPVLRAGAAYQKAIGAAWAELYQDPRKRSDS
jgi:hypothetical protein